METKSFRWLLEVLLHDHVTIPVLDTFLVNKSQVSSWITTDSKGKLSKKLMDEATYTLGTIDLISSEYSEAIKLRQRGLDIAYVYTREGRIVLSQNTLEEFKMRNLYGVTIFCIQRVKPHLGESSKLYRLKLEYSKNEYTAEFYLLNPFLKVKNREWFQEVKDIATTILAAILEDTEKVIVSIELDFMKDERNQFWLAYVWSCKLVPWDIFKESNFDVKFTYIRMDSKVDLAIKLKKREDKGNKLIKSKKKLYQFRVRTPEDSHDSEDDDYEHGWHNFKKNSKIKLLGSALLNGIISTEPKPESRDSKKFLSILGNNSGGNASERSLKQKSAPHFESPNKINPHFLELLCKTRAKVKLIKEGKIYSLRHEDDSELDREKEELLKELDQDKSGSRTTSRKLSFLAGMYKKESTTNPKSEKTSPRANIHIAQKLDFNTLSSDVTKKLSPIAKIPQTTTQRKRKSRKLKSRKITIIPKHPPVLNPLPRVSLPTKLLNPTISSATLSPDFLTPKSSHSPSWLPHFP
ncbi:unnamed protein product [Blepharisma stoltei]|uniref:Uncharacterized protein n=1 Tax=Blepharisma stoltei TaxID=1481888 RepID=A0AAU9JN82_9CILI|nr:unnamed protein product [Blepharisma stoltei]